MFFSIACAFSIFNQFSKLLELLLINFSLHSSFYELYFTVFYQNFLRIVYIALFYMTKLKRKKENVFRTLPKIVNGTLAKAVNVFCLLTFFAKQTNKKKQTNKNKKINAIDVWSSSFLTEFNQVIALHGVDKVISKTTSVTFSVFILTFKMLFNILKVSRQCCFRKEVDFRCLHVIAACVQEDYWKENYKKFFGV